MSYSSLNDLFTGICDAIRTKEETTDKIKHQDIPSRISALSSGSSKLITGDFTPTYNTGDFIHNANLSKYACIIWTDTIPDSSTTASLTLKAATIFDGENSTYFWYQRYVGSTGVYSYAGAVSSVTNENTARMANQNFIVGATYHYIIVDLS